MKTKVLKKVLVLNKSTISNLGTTDMSNLKGGWQTLPMCPNYATYEFGTCDCTFYCSDEPTYCPRICSFHPIPM